MSVSEVSSRFAGLLCCQGSADFKNTQICFSSWLTCGNNTVSPCLSAESLRRGPAWRRDAIRACMHVGHAVAPLYQNWMTLVIHMSKYKHAMLSMTLIYHRNIQYANHRPSVNARRIIANQLRPRGMSSGIHNDNRKQYLDYTERKEGPHTRRDLQVQGNLKGSRGTVFYCKLTDVLRNSFWIFEGALRHHCASEVR